MDVQGYLSEIRALYASGQTTEHSFRPALAKLFASIDPAITVINEPKHITDVGAPDFVFQRGDVAIGWCEAKDIGKDVRKFAANDYSKGQKERYRKGLPNLIYTNGLDFEFIRHGEAVDFITIADLIPTMPARPDSFALLENRLRDFAHVTPLSITSSKRLAEMMAGKAAIIKDIMGRALVADMKAKEAGQPASDLIGQYEAFKANLIHDITVDEFADIYAETIAYGLFAARLHDDTPATFTRGEALDLLPKSNPFLRELFIYIAGPNLDERLRRVIDELCDVFCATNMEQVLRHFGKVTARQDPFLHFYEVFLAEYNPAKRKARGVWYTPEPVVNFIVRAVDEVLKSEFGLADGLADTSRISIDWDTGQADKKGKPATIKKEVHRVQILDPATGTGTFLAEVVKLVSERVKGIAPGQWSNYVEQDLIPRIHGFELLMASYAMCHMKLDMILTGLGYKPSNKPPRLGVYLTNSLEEGERVDQTLFGLSRAIAEEAKAASDIKRQAPIMCVIGNPPYSSSSQNMSPFARGLVEPYKRGLSERKINLDDDYIKFVRLAETFIVRNGLGIAALITNNSYLDGTTLRGMRQHLLSTFDSVHVLNLFGDTRSGESSLDENVFDIMQGVAIVVMVKGGSGKRGLHYGEIKGRRADKYDALGKLDLGFAEKLETKAPYHFFIPKNLEPKDGEHFLIDDLFVSLSSGIQTKNDSLTIQYDKIERDQIIDDFLTLEEAELSKRYRSQKVWTVAKARADLAAGDFTKSAILYRPFDVRHTVQTKRSGGFLGRPRFEVMRHFRAKNLGLIVNKKFVGEDFSHAGVSDIPICHGTFYLGNRGQDFLAPLYLYPDEQDLDQSIRVNYDHKLYGKIRKAAGLSGTPAAPNGADAFRRATGDARADEVKVFDYIYGVLHCPAYRETYAEFLQIEFPRIPFPPSPEVFRKVSEQGEALRRLHLMEDAAIGQAKFPFEGEGDSVVDKPRFEGGKVWINKDQGFAGVPAIAWDFPIGGYHPAQKWLKDRKGRALSWDDIRHYQKIIKILAETDRIMQGIELPLSAANASD
ncbi:type ISP restriction/modification enzyme [Novosphingobium sp. PP1Y]|uniref:type ISP restriction/modification enzyme n=1 Tax=Novosphingobium sp. PP1Y TaxID=702113 RepID=UPI00020EF375|nr:type ISP restriction/modification enzyme [Novosphingobium sp. PP1Y]CCA94363.1 adenine specific DNA methyltransferase [Novosphingobium sp. PP1Y]